MRQALCAASLMLLTGISSVDSLLACGDKFLVSSRGTRYHLAPAVRKPAAILIYTNPVSDVPKALAGRRYSAPVDLVIEVTDRDLPDNAGRWRLTTTGSGVAADGFAATCSRTSDAADLALDIADLGAAYLGGTRIGAVAAAGLVTESRPGAVRQLSAAMSWDPLPWSPLIF